jgi:hypothetical protein
MTTEDKLDRLTDGTDALTQSVELLASLHRDYEARAEERAAKADERAAKLDSHIDRLIGLFEKMTDMVGNRPTSSPATDNEYPTPGRPTRHAAHTNAWTRS